jgi:hypothetical protein
MSKWIVNSRLFLKRNSSTILTCVGAVGVVATSVMAVKATPKAILLLEQAEEEKGEELTKLETVQVAGPVYIPSIIVGVSTIACVFGANILNKRQQASLMSAYALVDNSYKEYRAKVKELYGDDAESRINKSIAKDDYENIDISEEDDGKELFYDMYSKRYFRSTMEDVEHAEYVVNGKLKMNDYVYLNDFYDELGIERVSYGYDFGWSTGQCFDMYWQDWISFTHQKVVHDDGLECHVITMWTEPVLKFEEYC